MRLNKYWIVIGTILSAIILFSVIRITIEADYEKLKSDKINIPAFEQYDFRKKLHQEIEQDSIDFTEIYSSLSNRFIPTDFTENYWIVTTGVTAIDDGPVLYFTIPTYTRILVIKRGTEEIVVNKFFNFHVTNAKLKGSYVYFIYNSKWSEEYQQGRFKFTLKEELAS